MPLNVPCPRCGKSLSVPEASLGSKGQCPTCGHVFVLSDSSGPAAPPDLPPLPPANSGYSARESPYPPPASSYPPRDSGGYGAPYRDDFNRGYGGDWRSEPPPVSGPVTAPSTFHNLYLAVVGLLVLTILFACGGGVFVGFMGAQDEARRSRTRATTYNTSDPFGSASTTSSSDEALPFAMLGVIGVALLLELASFVVFCFLIYKAWDLIQDGQPQTTPGMAVGLLWIPCFNLYWMFIAVRGLAEDLNRYARWRRYSINEANVGIVTAGLILQICGMIPYLGSCFSLVGLILSLIGLASIKNAAAEIAAAKIGAM